MVVNSWIAANLIWITLAIAIVVLIYLVFTIIQTIRKKRRFVSQLNIILLILGLTFLIFLTYYASEIEGADWGQIILMLGLVIVTALYASSSVKMAEEMKEQRIMSSRPVIIQKAVPLRFIDEDTGPSDNFHIYNAGNGPAIGLEILLLDKDKKLLIKQRETFLRTGDAIKDFYPTVLGEHVNSDCYLLCRYQSIQSIGTKPSWYQTWLRFKPVKSQSKDYIYVQSGELEFEEVFEKKSY